MSGYIFKHVTDKILEQLKKGNVVWKKPWADNGPPRNLVSKRPYSGINSLLLAMAGYAAPFWTTKESAVKLGGRIRDNEFPHQVFFWKIINPDEPENEKRDENKETRLEIFYKAYHLFNVEQCEGIEKKIPPFVFKDFNPIDKCDAILKNMPVFPNIMEMVIYRYLVKNDYTDDNECRDRSIP